MQGPLRASPLPFLLCGLALGLAPLAAFAASGSKTTYLTFEPGSGDSAINLAKVSETLEIDSIGMARKPFWYLVRGLTGQAITLRLTGAPGTRVLFSCPGAQSYADVRETPWSFELPESGDYLLRLEAEGAKEGTSFPVSLEVELRTRKRPIPPSASGLYGRNGGEDAMIDVAQGTDGTLQFYLYAFWKGGQLPEIFGRVPLDKGVATYKDGDCIMTFQFKDDRLDIQGTGACPPGSTEAVFGTYQRSSHCGWPRTPKR